MCCDSIELSVSHCKRKCLTLEAAVLAKIHSWSLETWILNFLFSQANFVVVGILLANIYWVLVILQELW